MAKITINQQEMDRLARDLAPKLAQDYQAPFDEFQAAQAGKSREEIASALAEWCSSLGMTMNQKGIDTTIDSIVEGRHVAWTPPAA